MSSSNLRIFDYAELRNNVVKAFGLKVNEALLLDVVCNLASYRNRDNIPTGVCAARPERLQATLSISERAYYKYISNLKSKGLLISADDGLAVTKRYLDLSPNANTFDKDNWHIESGQLILSRVVFPVRDALGISSLQFIVLSHLDSCLKDSGEDFVYTSAPKLAHTLGGVSERTLKHNVKTLREMGLLEVGSKRNLLKPSALFLDAIHAWDTGEFGQFVQEISEFLGNSCSENRQFVQSEQAEMGNSCSENGQFVQENRQSVQSHLIYNIDNKKDIHPTSSTLTARVDDDDDGVKRFELREKISAWYQSEDAPVLTDDVEVGGKEIGELCKQYKRTYKLPKFYERVFGEYIPSGEIDETLIQELFAGLLRAMQPEGHSISLRSYHSTTIQGVTIEQLVDVLPSWLSGAHHKTPQSLAKWAKNNRNQGASHGTDRSRNAKFNPSYSPGTIENWKPSSNGNSFMEHYGSQA